MTWSRSCTSSKRWAVGCLRSLVPPYKGFPMRRILVSAVVITALVDLAAAQQASNVAQHRPDPATAQFDAVLGQALQALSRAGSYSVDVDSKWSAAGADNGSRGGSHYRLIWKGGKYRIEVQSQAAPSPDLICVND